MARMTVFLVSVDGVVKVTAWSWSPRWRPFHLGPGSNGAYAAVAQQQPAACLSLSPRQIYRNSFCLCPDTFVPEPQPPLLPLWIADNLLSTQQHVQHELLYLVIKMPLRTVSSSKNLLINFLLSHRY